MTAEQMKEYLDMSPFELKNLLIRDADAAAKKTGAKVLNVGRGNPNFLNTTVREAFSYFNLFASELAGKEIKTPDLGMRPAKKRIAKKLYDYCAKIRAEPAKFLADSMKYAINEYGFDPDEFIFEMTDAVLGDFYPSPPRIFPQMEKIINKYLIEVLSPDNKPARGKFDLFAVEGATAAMVYIFKSLKENRLLKEGDHIAILTPIFSPYLEIPALNDYRLVQIHIEQNEKMDWQVPDGEIEKLKDKKVKAFFMVHPTNPTSVKLNEKTMKKIKEVVNEHRKEDLIILTDTVYATFVDGFHSLIEILPYNTICCYSYSKFFGVTGWRLGVIMLHENNIIDDLIGKLPESDIKILDRDYKMDSATPEKIKFIERLEMDSRDVALAHTGGLSCPQQAIMTLCSLFFLMDKELSYKRSIQAILRKRIKKLYDTLEIKLVEGPDHTYYYALIDVNFMAQEKYGKEFAEYLRKDHMMIEFLFKLAKEKYTICLPGRGFRGPRWSLRVSLANLDDEAYVQVGKNISEVMGGYYQDWKK
ncbi:MAG: bifunctional aspartate transaminase/aspartate 4-decarboxylase [bacterium]